MAEEQEQSQEQQQEDYAKPNPAINPRNISLGEIAKTVAKQHTQDAVEDNNVASIDDDGNITPAKEVKAEAPAAEEAKPAETPTEPVAEAPALAAEVPAVPSEAPAQDSIDPKKKYKVKVDGQDVEVDGQKIIDAGFRTFQKETAADVRLKLASELLERAKQQESAPQQEQPQQPQKQEGPSDVDLAQAIQFGTPDQAAAAIATLKTRGAVDPQQIQNFVVQQTRAAARDEMQFQDALTYVKTEYKDLLDNDYLKRLFFVEENRRRASKDRGGEGDVRPYKELYQAIGDDLRKAFKLSKPSTQTVSAKDEPSTSGTAQARAAAKAAAPSVPKSAASRLAESEGTTKAKSPSEIIAGMAAMRGKDRLTARKE